MALRPGQQLSLTIEKPAAGGRMIARHDGQIVLVANAIPGEQVLATISRVAKGVAFADVARVEVASPDRRPPFTDQACGGTAYAHIDYPRQLAIKAAVITDGLVRIGRLVPPPLEVRGSKAEGYRMRARVHHVGHRIGFFREGSHHVCSARATRQLLDATCDVIDELASRLRDAGAGAVREIEISENLDGSQRSLHLDAGEPVTALLEGVLDGLAGVSGVMLTAPAAPGEPPASHLVTGDPYVFDLLPALVTHVTSLVPEGTRLLDLYAGVGLFAVSAAVARGATVTAVEGDPYAARDLEVNQSTLRAGIAVAHQSVETYLAQRPASADVVVLDPPRTGVTPDALQGLIHLAAPRIIYVSCDVATLARDVRMLAQAGYRCEQVEGFDLFPNTAHVETVMVLAR